MSEGQTRVLAENTGRIPMGSQAPELTVEGISYQLNALRDNVQQCFTLSDQVLAVLRGTDVTEELPTPPRPVGLVPLLGAQVAELDDLLGGVRSNLRVTLNTLVKRDNEPSPPVQARVR